MINLTYLLIILCFILIYLFVKEIKIKNLNVDLNKEIKNNNKILFYKLQKQYLNNVSDDDIEDLIVCLNNYFIERKLKNEKWV